MIRRWRPVPIALTPLVLSLLASGPLVASSTPPRPEIQDPAAGSPRRLTFADRVEIQRALDRLAYAHRSGAGRPVDEVVTDSLLERKVRTYLKQDAALRTIWRSPVTSEAVDRELRRIVNGTRMPARLREAFTALGDDPLLIREGLARPILVDRLARERFAFDARIHRESRIEADAMRALLAAGRADAAASRRQPTVSTVALQKAPGLVDRLAPRMAGRGALAASTVVVEAEAREFGQRRRMAPARVGEIGPVVEEREAFSIRVLLDESPGERFTVATYSVPKIRWDSWWAETGPLHQEDSIPVADLVAAAALPLPDIATGCQADDTWSPIATELAPVEGRSDHASVWTGSEMIVFGGGDISGGYGQGLRYAPLTDTWSWTAVDGAPVRFDRTLAVWTGTEMIVWGEGGNSWPVVGARYDPAADAWAPVSTAGVPAQRRGATVVWTGTAMIVWGGRQGSTYLDSGGVYDPAADAWSPVTTTGAPEPRTSHTAIWDGSRMLVWGGARLPAGLATGGRYDPDTDQWEPIAVLGAASPRFSHTAIWTGSRMVVWGGVPNNSSPPLDTGAVYDPAQDAWEPMPPAPAGYANWNHTAVWDDTRMLIWGGTCSCPSDAGLVYDVATAQWTLMSMDGAPARAWGHSAIWGGTELIVWGGTPALGPKIPLHTGGRYDPTSDSWMAVSRGSAPFDRRGDRVWTGHEVIAFGGAGDNPYAAAGSRYDPTTDTWTELPPEDSVDSRSAFRTVWTGSELIVWGGAYDASHSAGAGYDPLTDAWTPLPTLGSIPSNWTNATLRGHVLVWTGTEVLVWGGYFWNGHEWSFAPGGVAYNPRAGRLRMLSGIGAPTPRADAVAFWTGDRMIVWGGYFDTWTSPSGTTYFNDGALYDPVEDTWLAIADDAPGVPALRTGFAAVWTGNDLIIWGGCVHTPAACDYPAEGAMYTPGLDHWTTLPAAGAPSGRTVENAVWTGKEMLVWGGGNMETYGLADGGRFDPVMAQWASLSAVGVPLGRSARLVWTGQSMIVTGYSRAGDGAAYSLGQSADYDGDGVAACLGDCNDFDAAVAPGMPESCNRGDDNCDGFLPPAEADSDGDGVPPCAGDCRDDLFAVRPGAAELCDGVDGDCDGSLPPGEMDSDGDGTMACAGDCDDADPARHPGAVEQCNFADDDCDGLRDEDLGPDSDGDGAVDCADCRPTDAAVFRPPHSVTGLHASFESGPLLFLWDDQSPLTGAGTMYDVYSGSLGALGQATGGFSTGACLLPDLLFWFCEDVSPIPAPGEGWYFLVRAHNACGFGSYGSSARDQGVAASPLACP